MALFRRNQEEPAKPQEPEYSLDKIRIMLDQIGLIRLRVFNPKVKVLLTLISQRGEEYLIARSVGGTPSEVEIVKFQNLMVKLLEVLEKYVEIQGRPVDDNTRAMLQSGYEAADGLAKQILSSDPSTGVRDNAEFMRDAQILSAQQYR